MSDETANETSEPTPTPWSEMSSAELLDRAQAMVREAGSIYRITDQAAMLQQAAVLAQAAHVRAVHEATQNMDFVLEYRLIPGITNAIWEGMRSK